MAKTETQPYEVIKKEKDFEIRKYPPATMSTVSMEAKSYKELSSTGFRTLASFIFGGNQSKKSIAMTSPVHMDINDSQSSMSFVMPAEYTKDIYQNPIMPTSKFRLLRKNMLQRSSLAVMRMTRILKKYATQLENALKKNRIEYFGHFRFLGYNAPYQFLDRRNEIIVSVRWK